MVQHGATAVGERPPVTERTPITEPGLRQDAVPTDPALPNNGVRPVYYDSSIFRSAIIKTAQNAPSEGSQITVDQRHSVIGITDAYVEGKIGSGGRLAKASARAFHNYLSYKFDTSKPEESMREGLAEAERTLIKKTRFKLWHRDAKVMTGYVKGYTDEQGSPRIAYASIGDVRIYKDTGPGTQLEGLAVGPRGNNGLAAHVLSTYDLGYDSVKEAQVGTAPIGPGHRLYVMSEGITETAAGSAFNSERLHIDESALRSILQQQNPQNAADALVQQSVTNAERSAIVLQMSKDLLPPVDRARGAPGTPVPPIAPPVPIDEPTARQGRFSGIKNLLTGPRNASSKYRHFYRESLNESKLRQQEPGKHKLGRYALAGIAAFAAYDRWADARQERRRERMFNHRRYNNTTLSPEERYADVDRRESRRAIALAAGVIGGLVLWRLGLLGIDNGNDKGADLWPFGAGDRGQGDGRGWDLNPLNYNDFLNDDSTKPSIQSSNTFDILPSNFEDPMSIAHHEIRWGGSFPWIHIGPEVEPHWVGTDTPPYTGSTPPHTGGTTPPPAPAPTPEVSTLPGSTEQPLTVNGQSVYTNSLQGLYHDEGHHYFGEQFTGADAIRVDEILSGDPDNLIVIDGHTAAESTYVYGDEQRLAFEGMAHWVDPQKVADAIKQVGEQRGYELVG